MPTFTDYFTQNMTALGLPAPSSVWSSVQTALANIGTIQGAIAKFGPDVTIGDLIGAGTLSEGFIAAGAISASAYVGAAIGSAAITNFLIFIFFFRCLNGLFRNYLK